MNGILRQLQGAFHQNRLSHAYLLTGPQISFQLEVAQLFAQWLLCENKQNESACLACRSCILWRAANHPNYQIIQPLEKSKTIKINQIRELSAHLSQSAQKNGYRVIIITPMAALPVQAANALLKTLEEPAKKTVLLLIDDQSNTMPATIVSRCQVLRLDATTQMVAHTKEATLMADLWFETFQQLEKSHNSISKLSAVFLKLSLQQCLFVFLMICSDWVRFKLENSAHNCVYADAIQKNNSMMEHFDLHGLYAIYDLGLEKQKMIIKKTPLNHQLCIESLLIAWIDNQIDHAQ